MHHNSNYTKFTNNNNSNLSNAADVRYCNVDNAFKYYNNVQNCTGPGWSHSNPPSNASPSKPNLIRQFYRTGYQNAANSVMEPLHYTNSGLDSYAPTSNQKQIAAGTNSNFGQKKQQRSQDYYEFPQYKIRHYGDGSTPRNYFSQEAPKIVKTSVHMEQERSNQHARTHMRSPRNDSATYAHNKCLFASERTWEDILTEPSGHSTNQHYEHYFSYFYNRGPGSPTKPANRKQTKDYFKETQFKSASRTERERTNAGIMLSGRRDVSNDSNRNLQFDDNHVLKEKLPSNNLPIVYHYNDNEWIDYEPGETSALLKVGDEYLDIKDPYDKEKIIDIPLDSSVPFPYRNHSDLNTNNNESIKKPIVYETAPRLPLTPKRIKGGAAQKKLLPSVHRVLLYNNQSPRMPRKQAAHFSRHQNQKHQQHAGGHGNGNDVPTVILVEPDNANTHNKNTLDYDRDDEYDDDDDLDNVSHFGESDSDSITSDTEDGYKAHAYKLTHSLDRFPSSTITPSALSSQLFDDDMKTPDSLLVPSLFPFVPPYLSFSTNTKKGPKVPAELHRILKWRVTNIMPKVVRLILANSGMRMLKKTNDWMGVWGKHLKSPCFKAIRSYQKINHLPGSFRIGRKDSCWKNLQRQTTKHSHREFGFMPRTFVIPNDLCALRKRWPKYAQRNTKWIIKPPASARGFGIRVVNKWGQIPKRKPLIVQKYIERPLLINGSKFDLRLYVLVTSVNPLRVFMYHNGLARFASVKYSAKADTLGDRCMHLTNYSINKFSSNYSKNEDVNACHGHKWTIKSLWTYLANRGVRTELLWEALRSLVLRTILAGENGINNMIRANVESKYSCFELFGFDVILDSDLVPWLLEVNISPSLHSELPLDAHVKAPLVQGVLNTALYNIPPKLNPEKQKELAAEYCLPPGTQMCYDKRMYINYLSREEKVKHNTFTRKAIENREEYIDAILERLTPDDVRCLIVAEDELARCAPLERIFPTDQTHKYLKYNDNPRYYNRLLDAWESRYANNRAEGIAVLRDYCQSKYHLQVPAPPAKKVSNASGHEVAFKKLLDAQIEDTKTKAV